MGANFAHNNITTSNDITHKMILHINVFCPIMKHLIFCEENNTLTITKNYGNLQIFLSSPSSPFNQIAFLQASIIAMYSASVVGNCSL